LQKLIPCLLAYIDALVSVVYLHRAIQRLLNCFLTHCRAYLPFGMTAWQHTMCHCPCTELGTL
jgi:hypothetical protein